MLVWCIAFSWLMYVVYVCACVFLFYCHTFVREQGCKAKNIRAKPMCAPGTEYHTLDLPTNIIPAKIA